MMVPPVAQENLYPARCGCWRSRYQRLSTPQRKAVGEGRREEWDRRRSSEGADEVVARLELADVAAAAVASLPWTVVALVFVGLGTGGIKPCVSTFGADQIDNAVGDASEATHVQRLVVSLEGVWHAAGVLADATY